MPNSRQSSRKDSLLAGNSLAISVSPSYDPTNKQLRSLRVDYLHGANISEQAANFTVGIFILQSLQKELSEFTLDCKVRGNADHIIFIDQTLKTNHIAIDYSHEVTITKEYKLISKPSPFFTITSNDENSLPALWSCFVVQDKTAKSLPFQKSSGSSGLYSPCCFTGQANFKLSTVPSLLGAFSDQYQNRSDSLENYNKDINCNIDKLTNEIKTILNKHINTLENEINQITERKNKKEALLKETIDSLEIKIDTSVYSWQSCFYEKYCQYLNAKLANLANLASKKTAIKSQKLTTLKDMVNCCDNETQESSLLKNLTSAIKTPIVKQGFFSRTLKACQQAQRSAVNLAKQQALYQAFAVANNSPRCC